MSRSAEQRLQRRAAVVNNEFERSSAPGRAACALRDDLTSRSVDVVISHSMTGAAAIVASDASPLAIIVD